MTGSLYYFYGLENAGSLFNDTNPIGKTFSFRVKGRIGEENVPLDYFFKAENEDFELEKKDAPWEGWKCFDGYGKIEGYQWAEGSVQIRENEDGLQSVAIQKTYLRLTEPIWKRHSAHISEKYEWIGFDEDLPDNLEIPEHGYYYDELLDPPWGRHYREQGILAYDDTEEIVILGIRDQYSETVEIPCEINGKPVTVLDADCFANCADTLRKVVLPDTLREIGDRAFALCKDLAELAVPDSVTKIGCCVFQGCHGLKKVILPKGLK